MKIAEIREQYPQYQDLSDRELVRGLHRKFYSDMPYADFLRKIDFSERVDPTQGMSGTDKFLSGAGKAFYDIGRGVKQLTGNMSREEVDATKAMDAPLMNTGAGVAGNILGNAAIIAPTAFIPGANTYAGAAAIGALSGAIQPVGTQDSRTLNTALGGGSGVAGQAIGNTVGRVLKPIASKLSPEEQLLAAAAKREGIPLWAGQATGSRPMQITESVMENLPLTSGSQLAAKEAQQRAFTAAALRRAGMTGDSANAGALLAQKQTLGGTMGNIAERNSLDFASGLTTKLNDIAADAAQHLPPDLAAKVTGTISQIQNQAAHQSALTGAMTGNTYQGWREPLRSLAQSSDGTGRYMGQIRAALDDAFRTQLPGAEGELFRGTSRQYANLKTIIDAMGGAGNLPAKGQIAPSQLGAALARSVGKENKAIGIGDMNELARIGQLFVRDQVPNSGTAQRQLIQGLLTAGGGTGFGAGTAYMTGHDPAKGAMLGAGLTGAGLLTPKLVQALMNSGAGQAYLKQGIANISPETRALISALARTGGVAAAPALTSE